MPRPSRRSLLAGLLAAAGSVALRLYAPMEARGVLEWTSGANRGVVSVPLNEWYETTFELIDKDLVITGTPTSPRGWGRRYAKEIDHRMLSSMWRAVRGA